MRNRRSFALSFAAPEEIRIAEAHLPQHPARIPRRSLPKELDGSSLQLVN